MHVEYVSVLQIFTDQQRCKHGREGGNEVRSQFG